MRRGSRPARVAWLLLMLMLLLLLGTSAVAAVEHRCIHADDRLQRSIRRGLRASPQLYGAGDTTGQTPHLREAAQRGWRENGVMGFGGGPRLIRGSKRRDANLPAKQRGRRLKNSGIDTGSWRPIRLVVDTSNLWNSTKICTAVGEVRPDFMGSTYVCASHDIMTREKLWAIENIAIPLALYRTQRLFNVNPVRGPLVVAANACGPDVAIPPVHLTTGVEDADMVLYAHAGGMGKSSTSGIVGTIAWAGHCSTDQFGRPVVGHINFVPSFIQGFDSGWKYDYYLRVVVHELFHALGYTPAFLNNMVNASERRGKFVLLVTAPAVVAAARVHLNCPTLDGVELEDEGGGGVAGTHWERRQWMDELMAGVPTRSSISQLSLAFFASLAFYTVNMQYSEPMGWAHGAGCALVDQACSTDTPLKGLEWCNESTATQACVYDRTSVGYCDVGVVKGGLPPYFRYFPNNPSFGGLAPLTDHCPIVLGYGNRHCRDPSLASKDDMIYGFYYGPQSRCVPARNMVHVGYQTKDASPRCLRVRCRWGTQVEILVGNLWLSCPADGSAAVLSIPYFSDYRGEVYCERAELVCSPEIFYIPDTSNADLGPLREYALDLVLVLNSTMGGKETKPSNALGCKAVQEEGSFFALLQQDLAVLCSCDFGAGEVRVLPEQASVAVGGGAVALYLQLGVKAGRGRAPLERRRAAYAAAFAVGSVMGHLAADLSLALGGTATVTLAASELLAERSILDGLTSLSKLVDLGEVTLHCEGHVAGIPPLSKEGVRASLAEAARSDISQLMYLTPNLIQVKHVRVLGAAGLQLTATLAFPPIVEDAGGRENVLLFWSQLLNESVARSAHLSALSSALRVLSGGAPVSLTESWPAGALSLRSATVEQAHPEYAPTGDPRCLVQFSDCFVLQIVVLVALVLSYL
ncbi:surface protease GP63 [Trypanosoma conorhini]|uniref:leishmanolysin n=1 Tax=Trypanosoma conorhini TaxID=83891 RepID=A0A3S5IUJ6_9TRYP|nr:surface protease GP63 [Trypanosoma conorhini]RNF26260.1 surface protease GP63 [Trypanosoma conorhini]